MDDKNDSKKPQGPSASENLSTPPDRKDSLPPFPIANPAQPNQGQTLSGLPQPQQGQTLMQGPSAQTTEKQGTSLNIKPSNFGSSHFSLLKVLAVFLIVIFAVISSGSIALAYNDYEIFNPPKLIRSIVDNFIIITPLPETPRIVLEKTTAKMADLKTAVLELEISASAQSPNFPIKSAKLNIKGPADFKEIDTQKSQFDIAGEVAVEGLQLSAAASVVQQEDKVYFKLAEIPAGSFLPLEGIKNQWFVTTFEGFQSRPQDLERGKRIDAVLNNFISRTYQWAEFAKSQEKDVFHLTIAPPKEEIDNLIFEIIDAVEPKSLTGVETSIQKENLSKFTKGLKNTQFDLKIDKDSYLPKEGSLNLTLELDVPDNLFSETGSVTLAPTAKTSFDIKTSVKFSDYNQPVIVEIPKNVKDLDQYLKEFEKELEKQDFKLPQEQDMPSEPQGNNSFRNLLDNQSPVLGEKSFWDLAIYGIIRSLI